MNYEGQICRAPMERGSFMLPVMVGCSYNACKFCNLFRHLKYRELPLSEVEAELERVKATGGNPRRIFLGDGNAFTYSCERLLEIIALIRKYFPDVPMINMDATVTSILEKSDDELQALYDAGVRHLYLGIETGLDDVLHFMNKDHSLPQAYEAIERLQAVGLIYDAHIMTGVAGAGRGAENAEALAGFFNRTHPARVCNFSMFLQDNVPLGKEIREGRFVPASELDNLIEDRLLRCQNGRRLIQDQHFRPLMQELDNLHALLLTDRQLPDICLRGHLQIVLCGTLADFILHFIVMKEERLFAGI